MNEGSCLDSLCLSLARLEEISITFIGLPLNFRARFVSDTTSWSCRKHPIMPDTEKFLLFEQKILVCRYVAA